MFLHPFSDYTVVANAPAEISLIKRDALPASSSWDSGYNLWISMRPASESANLGTNSTLAEPVKIKRQADGLGQQPISMREKEPEYAELHQG